MENRKVLFYGAGEYAMMVFKRYKKEIEPRQVVAFIDSNNDKWGMTFMGLPVMSLADAIKAYADFDVYITTNPEHIPEIIVTLMENGFIESQIINYEPIEKAYSCHFIENSVLIEPISAASLELRFCCPAHGSIEGAIIKHDDNDEIKLTIYDFISVRNEQLDTITRHKIPACCHGCPELKEQWRFKLKKIRLVMYGGSFTCNCQCVYCDCQKKRNKASDHALFLKFIAAFEQMGLLSERLALNVTPGELSIHYQCEMLLDVLKKYPLFIASNAIKYSKAIAAALKSQALLNVSLDAGTRETYTKIKGVDCFTAVGENLTRYAQAGPVTLKYIFLPGINDNERDLNGFFAIADRVASTIVISRNFDDTTEFTDNTLSMIHKFMQHFKKRKNLQITYITNDERTRLANNF